MCGVVQRSLLLGVFDRGVIVKRPRHQLRDDVGGFAFPLCCEHFNNEKCFTVGDAISQRCELHCVPLGRVSCACVSRNGAWCDYFQAP